MGRCASATPRQPAATQPVRRALHLGAQAGPGRRLPQSIIRTVATPGEARPPYIVCYRPAPEAPPSAERKRKAERKVRARLRW